MTLEYLKVCCAIDTLSKFWSQLGERRVDRETQRKREGKSYLRPGVQKEVTTLWGTPSNVWCWIKTDDWARLKLNRDHNVRFRHYFIELKNPFSHIWQKWYSALQIQFSYLIIYLSLLPPAVRRAKKENSKYNWQKTLPQMHLQPKNVLSYGLFSVYTVTHPCVVFCSPTSANPDHNYNKPGVLTAYTAQFSWNGIIKYGAMPTSYYLVLVLEFNASACDVACEMRASLTYFTCFRPKFIFWPTLCLPF